MIFQKYILLKKCVIFSLNSRKFKGLAMKSDKVNKQQAQLHDPNCQCIFARDNWLQRPSFIFVLVWIKRLSVQYSLPRLWMHRTLSYLENWWNTKSNALNWINGTYFPHLHLKTVEFELFFSSIGSNFQHIAIGGVLFGLSAILFKFI